MQNRRSNPKRTACIDEHLRKSLNFWYCAQLPLQLWLMNKAELRTCVKWGENDECDWMDPVQLTYCTNNCWTDTITQSMYHDHLYSWSSRPTCGDYDTLKRRKQGYPNRISLKESDNTVYKFGPIRLLRPATMKTCPDFDSHQEVQTLQEWKSTK